MEIEDNGSCECNSEERLCSLDITLELKAMSMCLRPEVLDEAQTSPVAWIIAYYGHKYAKWTALEVPFVDDSQAS